MINSPSIVAALVLATGLCNPASASVSGEREAGIVQWVDRGMPSTVQLLEQLVNIDSATVHPKGVRELAEVLALRFARLGFEPSLVSMDALKRGPSLVAEHPGSRGKRVLLIGHMDTLLPPSNLSGKFVRSGDVASGAGVADMKGGIVVMLSALDALNAARDLDGAKITVFLTSDGESLGGSLEASRRRFIDAGKRSDAILSFAPARHLDGLDYAVTSRLGQTLWELRVNDAAGQKASQRGPSGVAVSELSRMLGQFHDTLKEANMTYEVTPTPGERGPSAVARGNLRVLGIEQLLRVEEEMHAVAARHVPQVTADIRYFDEYPPMGPAPGNIALLAEYNRIGTSLGAPEVLARSPLLNSTGDASFVAPYADTLDGVGAPTVGSDSSESVDLSRLALQIKRTALLIYSLSEPKR